jgi:hypothetical protein
MSFMKEKIECLRFFCFIFSLIENSLRQHRNWHIYRFRLISSEVRCTDVNVDVNVDIGSCVVGLSLGFCTKCRENFERRKNNE